MFNLNMFIESDMEGSFLLIFGKYHVGDSPPLTLSHVGDSPSLTLTNMGDSPPVTV